MEKRLKKIKSIFTQKKFTPKVTFGLALVASTVIGFHSEQAHAQMTVHDVLNYLKSEQNRVEQGVQRAAHENWMQQVYQKAEQEFKKEIEAQWDSLFDQDTQKAAAQSIQNTVQKIKSDANQNQQKENLATVRAVQGKTYDAARSATTGASICNNITGAIKTANFDKAKEIYQSQLVQQTSAAGNGFAGNKFLGGTNFQDKINAYHCAHNATLNDVKNHRCEKVTEEETNDTKDPSANKPVVAADTNANIVLGHSDFSERDQQNFNNMMMVLHNQAMGTPPNTGSMDPNSPSGRAMIQEQTEKDAMTSIGMAAMADAGAERAVVHFGDDSMQNDGAAWAEATAANVVGYNKDAATGKYFPNGVSNQDVTELRSKTWYYNPQSNLREGTENEAASIKDIGSMMAWQQVMNFKILKTLQSIQFTLGALEQIEAGHEGAKTGNHSH